MKRCRARRDGHMDEARRDETNRRNAHTHTHTRWVIGHPHRPRPLRSRPPPLLYAPRSSGLSLHRWCHLSNTKYRVPYAFVVVPFGSRRGAPPWRRDETPIRCRCRRRRRRRRCGWLQTTATEEGRIFGRNRATMPSSSRIPFPTASSRIPPLYPSSKTTCSRSTNKSDHRLPTTTTTTTSAAVAAAAPSNTSNAYSEWRPPGRNCRTRATKSDRSASSRSVPESPCWPGAWCDPWTWHWWRAGRPILWC
mmetsp:Transcript_24703/g.51085  ORF Transcript_24703/g.51085 Transcript_24703/m.51085 type:complete len:250 (+) Transcript_24703:1537-2286(+)